MEKQELTAISGSILLLCWSVLPTSFFLYSVYLQRILVRFADLNLLAAMATNTEMRSPSSQVNVDAEIGEAKTASFGLKLHAKVEESR